MNDAPDEANPVLRGEALDFLSDSFDVRGLYGHVNSPESYPSQGNEREMFNKN